MSEMETYDVNQYLTFTLGSDDFAIAISRVREVLDYKSITEVPRSPDYLKGVINLRGNVVPVIDLRQILGMPPFEQTRDTCIVIVEVDVDDERLMLGALADSVQEVVEIPDEQIDPPPKLGTRLNTEFIQGMGKRDETFIMILDIDRVLSKSEQQHVGAAATPATATETVIESHA